MRQGALRSLAVDGLTPARRWMRATGRTLLLAGAASLACHAAALAQAANLRSRAPAAPLPDDGLGPRDLLLQADTVAQDQPNSLVTASGHVQARYQGRTLRADKLVYNTVTGVTHAYGHAVIVNPDGSTIYGDDVTLDDQFRAAVALGFAAREVGNTTLAAGLAVRRSDEVNQLNNAVYTACNLCAQDGRPVPPAWSITATRITEDRAHHVIYYRNAVIRVLGVPVFYAPVFWHPDPSAPRRSGFLTPKIEYSRRRGASIDAPYLLAINPSTDLIVAPQISSRVNPFLNLRLTERFYSGEIDVRAGYTYSEEFNNHQFFDNDTSRSYILARGLFDVTPDKNWVWGFGAERVTDPTIFARYGIHDVYTDRGPFPADTDRLISQLYTVKADTNSYLSLSALDFQSLRAFGTQTITVNGLPVSGPEGIYESSRSFPIVGPLVEARYDAPNPLLGGQLRFQASAVALTRSDRVISVFDPTGVIAEGPQLFNTNATGGNPFANPQQLANQAQARVLSALSYTDSRRASVGGDWRTSFTLDNGIRIDPFVYGRADGYSITNPVVFEGYAGAAPAGAVSYANPTTQGIGIYQAAGKSSVGRISGTAGVNLSWPFIKPIGSASLVLEPLAQVDLSPVYKVDPNIPNEDSASFEYDETNLFSIDRFSGFDLLEGGQRLNVGGRASVTYGSGQNATLLVGRTFRAQQDPQFSALSGLEQTSSDWIVAGSAQPYPGVTLFTRSRLDRNTYAVEREEAGVGYSNSRFSATVRYDLNESGTAQVGAGTASVSETGENLANLPLGQTVIQKTEDASISGYAFVTRHWGISANVSRDLQQNLFPVAQVGLIYDNECVRVDVIYTHDETFSNVIGTSNNITFRISLTTLGGTSPLAPTSSRGSR